MKLVKLRGESMQAAADARPSAMVSVIGIDAAKACARLGAGPFLLRAELVCDLYKLECNRWL